MADDLDRSRLTLTVDWPEITLDNLSRIAGLWTQLVQSVSREVTGRRKGIRWVVRSISFASPLEIVADPQVTSDKIAPVVAERVSHAVPAGIEHLVRYQDQPDHFSLDTLAIAKKLAELADPLQHRRLMVSNGSAGPVEVTARVTSSVNDIFGPIVESYGTVEGTLEGVITHGRRRFYVYDSLVGRQVRCHFDDVKVRLSDVLSAFERRVSVSGIVRSKALTGERLSVDVREFYVFTPDDKLMPLAEIQDSWGRE